MNNDDVSYFVTIRDEWDNEIEVAGSKIWDKRLAKFFVTVDIGTTTVYNSYSNLDVLQIMEQQIKQWKDEQAFRVNVMYPCLKRGQW